VSYERLSSHQIWQLRRLTTPTVYNGWEIITRQNASRDGFNIEETRDFMPEHGPMAGRAVTVTVRVGGPAEPDNRARWTRFREHVASVDGPKIVVVQDLDKPAVYGSLWGEIGGNTFKSLGCVGTITDGGMRDLDELRASGFKAIARRACVGHGVAALVEFNTPVEVFGRTISPGQLVHADQHGFLAVPPEDEVRLLAAAKQLDAAEADLLRVAREPVADAMGEFHTRLDGAIDQFVRQIKTDISKRGEW